MGDQSLIFNAASYENRCLNPEALCVVRSVEEPPDISNDGSVAFETLSQRTEYKSFRPTVHVTLNHKVRSHATAAWDDAPYTVIADFQETLDQNGVPMALNVADTWWTRDVNEALIFPNATVVQPGPVEHGLYVIDLGNHQTRFKSENFTCGDIDVLFHSDKANFSENNGYLRLAHTKLENILSDSGLSFSTFLETSKNPDIAEDLLFEGIEQKIKEQCEQILSNLLVSRLAIDRTIEARGYEPQIGGDHNWDREDYANSDSNLAHKLDVPFGAATHRSCGFLDFEDRINQDPLRNSSSLRNYPSEFFDPKVRNVMKKTCDVYELNLVEKHRIAGSQLCAPDDIIKLSKHIDSLEIEASQKQTLQRSLFIVAASLNERTYRHAAETLKTQVQLSSDDKAGQDFLSNVADLILSEMLLELEGSPPENHPTETLEIRGYE